MTTDNFTSFEQVAKYMDKPITKLLTIKKKSLYEIWKHIKKVIQNSHWKYWLGWLTSTSSPATPLLKTWWLRQWVTFSVWNNDVEIYTNQEWLALIHEYWITYKMTDKQRRYLFSVVFKWKKSASPRSNWWTWMIVIPPRPIWRLVLDKERVNVEKIVDNMLEEVFI